MNIEQIPRVTPENQFKKIIQDYKLGLENFHYYDGVMACTITSSIENISLKTREKAEKEMALMFKELKNLFAEKIAGSNLNLRNQSEKFISYGDGKEFDGPAIRFFIEGPRGDAGKKEIEKAVEKIIKYAETLGFTIEGKSVASINDVEEK